MTLTLIRHGLTEGNLKRLYYGSTDLPLTEAGIAALHSDPPAAPEAQDYYTSGMRRTEQTFAILFGRTAARDRARSAGDRLRPF